MIQFTCFCGKQLQTKDIHAGKVITCPACAAKLVVPELASTAVQREPRPAPRLAPEPEPEGSSSRTAWIIGGIAAGVLVLAGVTVILVIVLGGNGSSDSSAPLLVDPVREAADRAQSQNNLHQIGLAMHNFHAANRRFPPAVVYDAQGKPLYSWRVLLLPYLEEDNMYKFFHLNEPWDSPHNRQFLDQMPKFYQSPTRPSNTQTHYLVFDSPGCAFDSKPQSGGLRPFGQAFAAGVPMRVTDFTDGTSNTILVIEADKAVPWTKPEDLSFGPNEPLPQLGALYSGGRFNVGLADGSVRTFYRSKIRDATLRAAITRSGGEPLGPDWDDQR
jgi:hypothetical protein